MNDTCDNCRFFDKSGSTGYCLRYPPTVVPCYQRDSYTKYPVVRCNEWCGEHKEKLPNVMPPRDLP